MKTNAPAISKPPALLSPSCQMVAVDDDAHEGEDGETTTSMALPTPGDCGCRHTPTCLCNTHG